MKLNAFLDLLLDGLLRPTIRRVESLVAAKSTSPCADFPIAIGATKACINADFLHTSPELLREVVAVAVETPIVELVCGYWSLAHWLGGVVILLLRYAESVYFYDFSTTKLQLFSHSVSFLMKKSGFSLANRIFSLPLPPNI